MKLQKETKEHGRWYGDACGAAFAMELLGERWTVLIVRELMLGPRRFSDIRASLPGISAKVLTERLERMEQLGVLARRTLPPPGASRVFELTEWGYELEEVMQVLGRWAVRSKLHDPTLPLSPVSFLLSLRTMVDLGRDPQLAVTVAFVTGKERLVAIVGGDELEVKLDPEARIEADVVFRAAAIPDFAALIYGKVQAGEAGVSIEGDQALAQRFIALFELPAKFEPPCKGAG